MPFLENIVLKRQYENMKSIIIYIVSRIPLRILLFFSPYNAYALQYSKSSEELNFYCIFMPSIAFTIS